ncbi:tetratricopeptide repeat protein [Nocardioides jejuensis]|uniref:Tetratricopeptide repeat protein n=1 Tax=Nocardioides jejuensis TaxID=2502782 RepID=A0A4V2NXU5_9ACTN|nr:tetratricopeptide repeat protein [Nocardioides jejuensis]TCJ22572.1 tetratricopeptide repeat protein [Nocardioides jejuensis]
MADDWETRISAFWETVDLSDRDGAVNAMLALCAERAADDPAAAFELGGVHDSTGFEEEANRHYLRARALGLSGARLAQLNIQQGSTLRNLGQFDEAIAMLEATQADPSIGDARAVFLALALRDVGRHDEAIRLLIEALVPHLPRYRRSATDYARALTTPDVAS